MPRARVAPGSVALITIIRKGMLVAGIFTFVLLFPALALFGGSTNLINWGPGLLVAGVACLLLFDKDREALRAGRLHSVCFLGVLFLLWIRAQFSADVSATAGDSALIAFAAVGYLIGKSAGLIKSRALFSGLAIVAMLGFYSIVMQMGDSGWNLIYPNRSAAFPSGLFAHYNYSSSFCLAAAGLLGAAACREAGWLRLLFIGGAICAVTSIPLSLSRGGTLALAVMVATVGALLLARAFSTSKSVVSTWLPATALLALILIFGSSLVPLIGRNQGADGFYGDSVRISFWKAASEIATSQPWLGGGPGSFTWKVFHVMEGLTSEPVMAHNETMQLAVDYGYPALIAMAALLGIPMFFAFWRFVNKTDAPGSAWAAVGLLAMLAQSNFSFVFHTGPGAFIAALILGRLSRSLWPAATADTPDSAGPENATTGVDRQFLLAVRTHVDDFAAGRRDALSKLIATLSQSVDGTWRRGAYRLAYWSKAGDEVALGKAVRDLGSRSADELHSLSSRVMGRTTPPRLGAAVGRGWDALGKLVLAGCAVPVVLSGIALSNALIDAWVPVYQPQQLSVAERFERLLSLVERNPGLGMDRDVLAAGRACIYDLQSQEAREFWATSYQARILGAVPGWRVDPGSALLLAEIIGWAGDFQSALSYYDHAIAAQGRNEVLFMAHAFKGQYLYEIYVSAGAAGQLDRQRFYARQVVASFQNATAAMNQTGRLAPAFGKMLQECETFVKNGM